MLYLVNHVSVISVQWENGNEKLCAVEPYLQLSLMQCYILVNDVSVISVQWEDGNEKLCAVESYLQLG